MTDTIMSILTLIFVYFEFIIGYKDFIRKYRNRIMFAHSFSLEKFMMTDTYEDKDKEINNGLDARLKNRVVDHHKARIAAANFMKAEEPAEEEIVINYKTPRETLI